MKEKIKLNKKKIIIGLIILIVAIALISSILLIKYKKRNVYTGELARSMSYDQVKEGEEKVDGTDSITFDAFFLRDLDGDGYAEKLRGTARNIGGEDTLYMELNVLSNGRLEDAVIEINSDNFYFQTSLPRDNEIKENAIGSNIKQIKLNTINNGTQKMLTGMVRSGDYSQGSRKTAAIGNNISKYSKVNSITLRGTQVEIIRDSNGNETEKRIPIDKTITFNVDWHGTTKTEIPNRIANTNNLNQSQKLESAINEENNEFTIEFNVGIQEVNNELILQKAHIDAEIPELSGYAPSKVEVVGTNVTYTYDSETKKLIAEKEAKVNENGVITSQANDGTYGTARYNRFKVLVTYPLDAYKKLGESDVFQELLVNGYYEGYNNANEEFVNPYKSNIATNNFTLHISNPPEGTAARFDIYVGKLLYNPSTRYVVSKENILKIYNGISDTVVDDTYIVNWRASTGETGNSTGLLFQENGSGDGQIVDEFIKKDGKSISMENITSNVGIYFSNPRGMLGDDGWIKVYDVETDELIETFTKSNWSNYTQTKPYKYERPIKHIRVETSSTNINASLNIYNVKNLDAEYIIENISREEFDEIANIKSTLNGYLGGGYINTSIARVNYEAPYAKTDMKISQDVLSTQETKNNMEITINAEGDESANQVMWLNGAFLLKLPKDILNIEINSVISSEEKVKIISYEYYEDNGDKFIKINTENNVPAKYNIVIDCNITPDPRMATKTDSITLYSYNEAASDYWSPDTDIYDVNDNLNKDEKIGKISKNLSFVSPNLILTNETITDYDTEGTVVISPQTAILSKDQRTANINIEIKNNYLGPTSDVIILGRVPFENNKYVISGKDMGSNYSVKMETGISMSETLMEQGTIYYSENGEATKDLSDSSNGWTTTPADFSKVKSYLIDLTNHVFERNETAQLTYTIRIPEGLNYNQISYSHHAMYFSLNTPEGKYRTQLEPNKIGLMIGKEYNLEVVKYQTGTSKLVAGATYSIIEEGEAEGKTRVTGVDGKLVLNNLYVDRTYIVKEIKSPSSYELNTDEIKFKTSEENGQLKATILSGNAKKIEAFQPDSENGYRVQLEVEDEVKPSIKIIKTEKGTDSRLKGIRFKIMGEGLSATGKVLNTNIDGEVTLNGLRVGTEYTLEETKATGYYLENRIRFVIENNNGSYSVRLIEGSITDQTTEEIDSIPTINLKIENTKIPTYNLQINKVVKGENTPLVGAKFRLFKGTEKVDDYITDESGIITIANLYQYESSRNLDQTYTLKELFAPEGFSAVKDITFKVENIEGLLTMDILDGNIKEQSASGNTITVTIEDSPSFKLIKKDGETGEVLPGTKFAIYNVDDGTEQLALDSKFNILGTKETINGKEYYTLTTNENGEITANLREGLYKAVEVKTSDDKYELTNNAYYFGIGATREAVLERRAELYDQIGGTGDDTIRCMDKTADGGIIVGGHFENSIILKNGDNIVSNGSQDVIIIKYDKEGEIEWYKQIGGTDQECIGSMIATKDGGLAVGMGSASNFTLENGDQITANNIILIKYDENGNMQWSNKIHCGSSPKYDFNINAMCETINEDIVIGIRFWFGLGLGPNSGSGCDTCIAKYSKDGKLEWYKHQANEHASINNIYSMIGTSDGGIIYAKACEQKEFIDSDISEISNGGTDGYIVKLNSEGKVEWYKKIGGTENDGMCTVIETDDGKIIAGGYFRNSITLENGETITSKGGSDGILLVYNSNGEFEAYKQIGGIKDDEVKTISKSNDGGILVGGLFRDTLTLENNEKMATNNQDGFVLKYDGNEKLEWGQQISGNTNEIVYSLVELDNGEILAATEFNNNINLSNGKDIITKGRTDGAILKLNWKEVPDVVTKKVDTIGGIGQERLKTAISTSDGGIAVALNTTDSVTLENGDIIPAYECILLKYDKKGKMEWYDTMHCASAEDYSKIVKMCETPNGEIIIGIKFWYDFTFSNGGKIHSGIGYDTAIAKYSKDGKIKWYKHQENSGDRRQTNELNSIIGTTDGGIIYTKSISKTETIEGDIKETANAIDGLLVKLDSEGKVEWYKKIGGLDNDSIYTAIEKEDGGILAGGKFKGTIVLENGKSITAKGNEDIILLEYSKDGKFENYKQLITENTNTINGLTITKDGGIIYRENNKITKINVNGNIEWNTFPMNNIYSVNETIDGKIFICGTSNNKGIVVKCNSNGDIEWKKEIGKTLNSVIEKNDKTIVVAGEFTDPITLENGETITSKGNTDGLIVYLQEEMGIPDVQEIIVENTRKELKITTAVNEIDGIKGGSISGENVMPYETVKYGDSNKKEITLTPDVGYEIINITVNGEEYQFTANEDGTYTIPTFENITENKHIVVTYSLKQNKIIINKVDSYTKENLTGAEFRLDQIEERTNPKDVIGNLTDNSNYFCDTELSDGLGELTNNGEYYFVTNEEGKIVPTNSKTWQTANVEGATEGVHNSTAHSYIPIDLSSKTGEYIVKINATASSQNANDWGYATITESTTAPEYNETNGRFMYTDGNRSAADFTSQALDGGKIYYLHLGYYKNANTDGNTDQIIINSINLYSGIMFNFKEENGEYKSTNQGKANTTSNSYVPIDLTNCTGKYNLILKAKVSSAIGDYGYATVNSTETPPAYNNTSGRFVYINGNLGDESEYKEYTTVLQGGNKYYLHLGYYKNGSGDAGEDTFTVKDIKITLNDSELYHTYVETNNDGQAITQIPFGKYSLTEIRTPEGYEEQKGSVEIEFRPDGTKNVIENSEEIKDENGNVIKSPKVTINENGEFVVENISTAKVIVQHYIKGTEEKLSEDVILEGKQGDNYLTSPLLDLEKYELEKDSNGEFILPENASGIYTQEDIIVKYYYVEKQIPLIVHHYIEGTTENVPLANGTTATDEIYLGDNGQSYTTNPIQNASLSNEYELVELPTNKDGSYSGDEVIVIYYYKKVQRDIVIQKYELLKETDPVTGEETQKEVPLGGAKFKIEKEGEQNNNEYVTDINGKINVKLEVGRYNVTETQAPEGYKISENPTRTIEVTRDTANKETIKVANEKLKETSIIVHHYLIDRDGNKTTIEVAQYEILQGKEGEDYTTSPKTDLEKYELSITPDNATGKYTAENQIVNYYYVGKKTTLTVKHYMEGTTNPIQLNDGTFAEDEVTDVYVGDEYTTSKILYEKLPNEYEVVEVPENATGVVTNTPITVTYYYKKVQRNLNILKYDEDEKTPLQGVAFTVINVDGSDSKQVRTEPMQNNGTYYFEEQNGKYVSNNKGERNTTANSYIKIDLTEVEKATIDINATLSSYNALIADHGYVTITESTSAPAYDNSTGRIVYEAGKKEINKTQELQGGKVYYLHFGYHKQGTWVINNTDDIFTINSIKIDGRDYLDYTKTIYTEYITDENGKITLPLEYGEYNVTEISTIDGYKLPENPTQTVSVTRDVEGNDINLRIINEKIRGKVIVHHYVMEYDGTLTTIPVKLQDKVTDAPDEELIGILNDTYSTKPREDIANKWKYIKSEGETTGKYIDGTIEVTYYYQEQINVEDTISIEVTKKWNDNSIQALRRPNTIKFIVTPYEQQAEEGVITNEEVVYDERANSENVSDSQEIQVKANEQTEENASKNSNAEEIMDSNLSAALVDENTDISNTLQMPEEVKTKNINESTNAEEKVNNENIIEKEENKVSEENTNTLNTVQEEKLVEEAPTKEVQSKETQENAVSVEETANVSGEELNYYVFEFPNQAVNKTENETIYTLNGILKYDKTTGKKIQYIVTEVEETLGDLKFYEATGGIVTEEIDEEDNSTYKAEIVNTFKLPDNNVKDIKVTKVWKDNENKGLTRPSNLIIDLIGRVENLVISEENTEKYKEVNKKDQSITSTQNWQHTFTQNPIYDENGQEIEYRVEERVLEENQSALDRYIGEVGEINDKNEATITNSLIIQNSNIEKIGPESIIALDNKVNYSIDYRIELDKRYEDDANIKIVDTTEYEINQEISEILGGVYDETNKTITWTGTYNSAENKVVWDNEVKDKIVTEITEDTEKNVKIITVHMEIGLVYNGLQVSCEKVTNRVSGVVTLANNVVDEKEAVCETPTKWIQDVIVNKLWKFDTEETRPDSITVELKQVIEDENGNVTLKEIENAIQTITPITTEEGITEWTYTYKDLPRYDAEGNELKYTVDEKQVNYTKGEQTVENKYYCEKSEESIDGNIVITLTNNKYGSITVTKVDSRKAEVKLSGAEFKLEKMIEQGKDLIVPDESSEEYFSTIGTTGEDGTVTFEDLEYGYYKLTETKAPENYRITEKRIDPIQITKEDMEHLNVQITVRNDKQYTLPTTGGLGTNIIKGVEILVISIFGILLTNRKKIVPERRAKEENAEKPVRRTKKVKDTKPVRRNTGK